MVSKMLKDESTKLNDEPAYIKSKDVFIAQNQYGRDTINIDMWQLMYKQGRTYHIMYEHTTHFREPPLSPTGR